MQVPEWTSNNGPAGQFPWTPSISRDPLESAKQAYPVLESLECFNVFAGRPWPAHNVPLLLDRMLGRHVRLIMDHQLPIVACEFVDAASLTHTVIDKVWSFSEQTLNAHSQYPQPGVIRCRVLTEWRDTRDQQPVSIDIANPDQIESTEGLPQFVVARDQVSINVR
jgi:hypothetical protein